MAKYIRRRLSSKVEITTRGASENAFPSMPQFALNADSGFDIIKVKRDFLIWDYYYYNNDLEIFDFPFNNKDTNDPLFVYDGVVPEFDRYAEASYSYFDFWVDCYQELPLPMTIAKAKKFAKDNGIEALWALCLEGNTPTLVVDEVAISNVSNTVRGVIIDTGEEITPFKGDVTPISQADYDLFDLVRTATKNFNYHLISGGLAER